MTRYSFLFLAVAILMAADAWKSKPIAQWTTEDAKAVLADSAWAKKTPLAAVTQRGEPQLREGGRMGGGARRPKEGAPVQPTGPNVLVVRWESALPIRTAELKAGEVGAPDWDGDYYVIAVYDVPGLTWNQKLLNNELKRGAVLKRAGKKDLKPERVDLVPQENRRARVVYLFPRSEAITLEDANVEFVAEMASWSITQEFHPQEMQLLGKLEL
jgi:hypothetical protein